MRGLDRPSELRRSLDKRDGMPELEQAVRGGESRNTPADNNNPVHPANPVQQPGAQIPGGLRLLMRSSNNSRIIFTNAGFLPSVLARIRLIPISSATFRASASRS